MSKQIGRYEKLDAPIKNLAVAVVEMDGSRCIFGKADSFLEEMKSFFENSNEGTVIKVTFKEMRQTEYESLDEFGGW